MGRLYRPNVPLSVRCTVAARQLVTDSFVCVAVPSKPLRLQLDTLLVMLASRMGCEVSELRLDHDPPLGARPKHEWLDGFISYTPAANNPDHLFYRPHGPQHAGSHLIKTNVRGEHGQHPDRVLIKKARRLTENKPPKRKVKIQSRGFDKASRPFAKRNK